jgi:large conductance mechanosensitive channel
MEEPKQKKVVHRTLKITQNVNQRAKKSTQGFFDFIRTQGVVGLAIGFIIGTQARTLVEQFSKSFINPILGLVVGESEGLNSAFFTLTFQGNNAEFYWGAFIYALINFIIIAMIVYFTFKLLRLDKLDKKKP